jgi:hypothetical protein
MTIWARCFKQATFALYMYLMCITIVGPPRAYSTHHLMFVPTSLSLPHFFCSLTRQLNSDGCFVCDHTTIPSKPDLIFFPLYLPVPPLPQVQLSWRLRSTLWVHKVLPLVGPFPNGKTISCVRIRSKIRSDGLVGNGS